MRKIILILTVVIAISLLIPADQVLAQSQYSIKEMTPAVQSALEQRRDRYDQIKVLKQDGKVGENNKGYLKAFKSEDSVDLIVEKENADRKTIYQTIAEQNGIRDALGTIEKVFAQTQRDNAQSGEKIQLEDGQWTEK